MHSPQSSIQYILTHLDQKLWEALADKAIQKMVPTSEVNTSLIIMNDFTVLLANKTKNRQTIIEEVRDHTETFKENYIIGTAKIMEGGARSMSCKTDQPDRLEMRTNRARPKSRMRTEQSAPGTRKMRAHTVQGNEQKVRKVNNPFFQLTDVSPPNKQEQKIDDYYRDTKYSDIQYAKDLEQARKDLEQQRENHKIAEAKRLKEMKNYTYDFEGKLISTGVRKENQFKVINMRSQFSAEFKNRSMSPSRKSSNRHVSHVLDKKMVHLGKTPVLDPISQQMKKKRQKQQLEQNEKRKHIFNTNKATNKFTNLFNKDTRMAVGIKITNLQNRESVGTIDKDLNDSKRLTLTQFKNRTKGEEFYPSKKNLRLRKNQTEYRRTQGNEFIERGEKSMDKVEIARLRIKTQGNERASSNLMTSYRKTTGRGTIHVNHQQLYSQHFSPRRQDE